jgi:pyridoxal phosphate enzyme (YggS family)
MSALAENLGSVQERVVRAAQRAGRNRSSIIDVAVTKTQSADAIQKAYDLGLRHFGENRVEEGETKVPLLPDDITWHMIGHVQSRKARRVANLFQWVHSVDSLKLARRLSSANEGAPEPLPVLLEVNVSGEVSKYGFSASGWSTDPKMWHDLLAVTTEINALPHIRVQGLMTMAPIVSEPEEARPVFVSLRRLRDKLSAELGLDWPHLSMGMTDDFEVAIEEGATMIRVGRAIFDPGLGPWRKG